MTAEEWADRIYEATGLVVNAEQATAIGNMIIISRTQALDEAAQDIDCCCPAREAVLDRLEKDGWKMASHLCSHGDLCCALQAESILGLKEIDLD